MPDGRQLLFLAGKGDKVLILYDIEQTQGQLVRRSSLARTAAGWEIFLPVGLTVTPDGRFAAFRWVHPINYTTDNLISVVRLHEDGAMEYMGGKEMDVPYYVGDLAFAPLPESGAIDWLMYE